jgi:DNA repair exonuclease SbcCD ATPase subunit
MTNSEENPQPNFAQELEELEASLRFLKDRYAQVQKDQQQKAQWQQELKNLKQNSQLFSWVSLKRPFWQAIRFGGLGVIIGWLLKSWVG